MFVACSTLCFAREPLETALRQIAELEFDKFELALVEDGQHLRPSEVGDNPEAALHRLRRGPSLIPSSLHLDFGPVDWSDPVIRRRFDGLCRLAKSLSVAVLTIPAAPAGTPDRRRGQAAHPARRHAMREGLVLALLTHSETLTADPQVAVELCKAVPGLGLTLDPSHFLQGPHPQPDYDVVFPYVQNVHLRDTGQAPGEFQVRVGQGQVEYARIVNHAPAPRLQPRPDRRHHRPPREPLRPRGRGPQAQAAAGDADLAGRWRRSRRLVSGAVGRSGPPGRVLIRGRRPVFGVPRRLMAVFSPSRPHLPEIPQVARQDPVPTAGPVPSSHPGA